MAQYPGHALSPPRDERRFVPQFILDRCQTGEYSGRFSAAGVFFDLSGFTHLTESLMSHGAYGAEALATVVESVFAPLLDTVFSHGGFVISFHGDAFAALFPAKEGDERTPCWLAVTAAWRMRERLGDLAVQQTPFGEFHLAAKIGVAVGDVEWDILSSETGERSVYCFRGTAVDHCAHAENQATQNDIVVSPLVLKAIAERVTVEPLRDYFRLTAITAALPALSPSIPRPPSRQAMSLFLPDTILDLSLRGEFRQVISLFINLAGAPTLEELRDFSRLCFTLQRTYGGYFYRIIFDDKGCNLQVFWGAPTSYEKDVARALNFILELRRRCNVKIRAGMTWRRAFAGFVGSPLYQEYTCYSRGVNFAARLMSGAGWGEIWLGRELAEQPGGQFSVEYLGERTFKGISDPQSVFRLLGATTGPRPAFFRGQLVGREQELGVLEKAVSPIFDGRFAGVITIIGEAGSGKSRLAHAFLGDLESSRPCHVLRGQTDEILRQPLNPFRYALRDYFGQTPQGDDEGNSARFEHKLTELIAATADPDMQSELDRTRSFLGSLLDLHWADSLYEQVEPQLRVQNAFEALKTLLVAESLRRPLILLLEDVHVLDSASREFLTQLTRNIESYPIAVLATSRLDPDPALFDPVTSRHTIRLRPLGEDEVENMLAALIGERPAPGLARQIAIEAGGNPLFVEQLLIYLQNNRLLEAYTRSRDVPGKTDIFLPNDIRSLLVAQIDQLPPSLREASQVASILGREFNPTALSAMLPDPESMDSTLALGIEQGIWYALEARRYLFRHALLRDAAYDMQLTSRRRVLHHLAADTLLADCPEESPSFARLAEIAYHYDQADLPDAASKYYGQAGEWAARDYFNEQAITWFGRALELQPALERDPARYRLLLGREAVYQLLGHRDEQRNDLEELERILGRDPDAGRRAEISLRQAGLALTLGDYESGVSWAEQSALAATETGDREAEAKAYHRLGRAYWQQGHAHEAEPVLQRALELSRLINNPREIAECLHDLGVVQHYQGHYETARRQAREAQAIFETLANKQGLIRCYNLVGLTYYEVGDYLQARQSYEQALAISREAGWRSAEAMLLLNLGNYHFELGDYAEASGHHTKSLDLFRAIGDRAGESMALDNLGLTAHYQGRLPGALALFEQALEIESAIGNERNLGYILTHLGFTHLALGDPVAARAAFQRAATHRERLNNEAMVMDTVVGLAASASALGNHARARAHVEHVLAWIAENGSDGLELPVQTYLLCYHILHAAADSIPDAGAMAADVLAAGHDALQARANRIDNDELRRRFLENVPFNRRLLHEWAAVKGTPPGNF